MQGTNRRGEGGEQSLQCDPRYELRLGGREKKKGEDNEWDRKTKRSKTNGYCCGVLLWHKHPKPSTLVRVWGERCSAGPNLVRRCIPYTNSTCIRTCMGLPSNLKGIFSVGSVRCCVPVHSATKENVALRCRPFGCYTLRDHPLV